jgi:MFS family permease
MTTSSMRPSPPTKPQRRRRFSVMEKRVTVSGALGSSLEYFDFVIFGALSATLFPDLFFSGLGETGSLLASFATFGLGFAARPIGAIFFGHLGDRVGRVAVLYVTLLIMGISSALIGLLPTGQGIGIAVIIVGLRLIQGFSLGGEVTGNQLMAVEHADAGRRGLLGALVNVGAPFSQIVANMVLVVMTGILSEEQWMTWGWRVPFLSSILLVALTVYIRRKIEETPAFVADQTSDAPSGGDTPSSADSAGLPGLRSEWRTVLKLTLAWAGPSMCFDLIAVYGLTFMTDTVGISSQTSFRVLLVANLVSLPCCLLGGWISDRFDRKRVFFSGLVGVAVGSVAFFTIGAAGALPLLILFAVLTVGSCLFLYGMQPVLFAEQFPTRFRFSGCAISFTLANLLFSAFAPLIATALVAVGGTPAILWYTMPTLALSAVAVSTMRSKSELSSPSSA